MFQFTAVVDFLTAFVATRIVRSERGAALVEYALLVALIAVVCIGAITVLGTNASDKYSSVGSQIR